MGEELSQQFSDEGSRKALACQVACNRTALLIGGLGSKESELPLGGAAGLFVDELFGEKLCGDALRQCWLDSPAAQLQLQSQCGCGFAAYQALGKFPGVGSVIEVALALQCIEHVLHQLSRCRSAPEEFAAELCPGVRSARQEAQCSRSEMPTLCGALKFGKLFGAQLITFAEPEVRNDRERAAQELPCVREDGAGVTLAPNPHNPHRARCAVRA